MNKDQSKIKYFAYKSVYRRRGKNTPSKRFTWGQWFKVKFGEDIEDYHNRVQRKKNAKTT